MLAMVSGVLSFASAQAQQTRWLPASACRDGSLFADGIESGAIYSPDASSGAGPVASGNQQRQVLVGSSLRTYYVRVPPLYRADRPAPVLILLHGATGSSATTAAAAQDLRDLFSASADRAGVVLVAPPASGSSGGWVPAVDFIFIQAIQNDLAAAYVIDRQRRSVWGFSAGGHVAHGLVLGNAGLYAAYAVKAGVLEAYAGINAPSAATREVPLQSRIGSSDSLLAFAQNDVLRFINAGWQIDDTLQYREIGGGHSYSSADAEAALPWLCRWAVLP
jgi:phospholipase/carboxylesterase